MLNDLAALYTDNLAVFAGSVFLVGLVIGSFLNVVIYRLPIMLERDWRAQAAELMPSVGTAETTTSTVETVPERFTLSTPRSACPACKAKVELKPDGSGLKCVECMRVYPIRDDIPVMLVDEATIEDGTEVQQPQKS